MRLLVHAGVVFALACCLASVVFAAPAVDRDGWPATRAGELAHRWIAAFDAGEAQMKACLPEVMSAEALAKRPVGARVERYRDLKERFGSLTLVSVDKSGDDAIEVTLAASDMSTHRFAFKLEANPPRKLAQVNMFEGVHAGLGSMFHH